MVQILLLALAVGLACAKPVDYSKITGKWRTIAIASDNVEKIEENGNLRAYFRELECIEGCQKISIRFFIKVNGVCTESTIVGTRGDKDNVYTVDYSGENFFQILRNSDETIIISNYNTDENGQVTKGVVIAGKRNFLTAKEEKSFLKAVQEMGIPKEDIRHVTETDDNEAVVLQM